jgi:hypothetical protein
MIIARLPRGWALGLPTAPSGARRPWTVAALLVNSRYPARRAHSQTPGSAQSEVASKNTALLEAAHRVGSDGNGRDGIVGYFTWVAECDPTFFYVHLWSRLLELQIHEGL